MHSNNIKKNYTFKMKTNNHLVYNHLVSSLDPGRVFESYKYKRTNERTSELASE